VKRVAVAAAALLVAAPVAAAQEPPLPPDTIARVEQWSILRGNFIPWMNIAVRGSGAPMWLSASPLRNTRWGAPEAILETKCSGAAE
jgi:hypothetical protein